MEKLFDFKLICEEYPCIYKTKSSKYQIESYLVKSPFANCQSFSMGKAADTFYKIKEEDIKEFLFSLYDLFGRRQLIVDLREDEKKRVTDKVSEYTKKIIENNYKSTNGSDMVLCIIQLDPEKIIPQKKK